MGNSKQLQVGNESEKKVKEIFKKYGYWAYNTPKSKDGSQPVDIIALKKNISWLVDAKHVRADEISFSFSRIEPNQLTCLDYAKNFANIKNLGFAIYFERHDRCVFMHYNKFLEFKEQGKKSVNIAELFDLEAYLK